MVGDTLRIKEMFSEYKDQTESLIHDLESALSNFEKTGDVKELNSKFKERINQFQKEINSD